MQTESVFDEQKLQEYFCSLGAWELETGVLLVADTLETGQGVRLLNNDQRWGFLNLIHAGAFHWEEPFRDGSESIRKDKQGRRIVYTRNEGGFTHYDYFQWGMDTLHSTEAYLRALAALHGEQIEKLSRETVLQGKTVFYVRPASFIAWAHSVAFPIPERIRGTFLCGRADCGDVPRDGEAKGRADVHGTESPSGSEGQTSAGRESSEKDITEGQIEQAVRSGVRIKESAETCQDEQAENEMRYDRASKAWHVTFKGKRLPEMKHCEGFWYIVQVLSRPYEMFSSHDLRSARLQKDIPLSGKIDSVTREALRECRQRRNALEAAIEKEKSDQNLTMMAEHEAELDELDEEIKKMTNRYGEARSADPGLEKSRKLVSRNIKNARDKIKENSEELAAYLLRTITTGQSVIYIPEDGISFEIFS